MTHGFSELGDFAGMGIGTTTKKPHVVYFLFDCLLLQNLVTN